MLALYPPIRTELAGAGELRRSEVVRLARAQELLRQVEVELTRLGARDDPAIQAGQQQLVSLAGEHAQALATVSAGEAAAQVIAQWTRVPTPALEDLVGRLRDGRSLEQYFDDLATGTRQTIERELMQGVAVGRNPLAVAKRLRTLTDIAGERLLTLTRTELLAAYRSATLRQYQANADMLDGWIWTVSHSAKTCPACLALDVRVFPLSVAFIPTHARCRCSPSPALTGVQDQGGETGATWFARQDVATQDRILHGRDAGDAYRAGEVSLDDFAVLDRDARWGDRYRRGSLVEARARSRSRRGEREDAAKFGPDERKAALPKRNWEVPSQRKIIPADLQRIIGAPSDIVRMDGHAWTNLQSPPKGVPLDANGDALKGRRGQHASARPYVEQLDAHLADWKWQGSSTKRRGKEIKRAWEVYMRISDDEWLVSIIVERIDGEYALKSSYLTPHERFVTRHATGVLKARK